MKSRFSVRGMFAALALLIGGCAGNVDDPEGTRERWSNDPGDQTSLLASTPMAATVDPGANDKYLALAGQAIPAFLSTLPDPEATFTGHASCYEILNNAWVSASSRFNDKQTTVQDGVTFTYDVRRDRSAQGVWSLDGGAIECDASKKFALLPLADMTGAHWRANQYSDSGSARFFVAGKSKYASVMVSWSASGSDQVDFVSTTPMSGTKVRIDALGHPRGTARISINVAGTGQYPLFKTQHLTLETKTPLEAYGITDLEREEGPFWEETVIERGMMAGRVQYNTEVTANFHDVVYANGDRCKPTSGTIDGNLGEEQYLITFTPDGATIKIGDDDEQPFVPMGCPA